MADYIDALRPLIEAPHGVFEKVLRLNQAHATELSELDEPSLRRLIDGAFFASVVNDGEAFIIAFDQDAAYDSPNFRWFHDRYRRFVYVDRIAVDGGARGRGLAHRMYRSLFERASELGHSTILCEVNLRPANRASDAFHSAYGFEEVGRAAFPGGKIVRYLAKQLINAAVAT